MEIDFQKIAVNLMNRVYPMIGSGSGRVVYDLGDGTVVKAAKNKKGYAQNFAEQQISAEDTTGLFAKVLGISDNQRLLIMQKAEKIRDIGEVCAFFHVRSRRELLRLYALQRIVSEYKLIRSDLILPSSWGFVDHKPVLIDYGFTMWVRMKYYRW